MRGFQVIHNDGSSQHVAKEGLVALLTLDEAPCETMHMIFKRRQISKQATEGGFFCLKLCI